MQKFWIEDREYEFDGDYTVEESMLFYDKCGVGMTELNAAFQRGNPYAAATLMYILKKRAGEAVRWQDMLKYKNSDFGLVEDDVPEREEPAGEAPDPTQLTGTTPEPDTDTTS